MDQAFQRQTPISNNQGARDRPQGNTYKGILTREYSQGNSHKDILTKEYSQWNTQLLKAPAISCYFLNFSGPSIPRRCRALPWSKWLFSGYFNCWVQIFSRKVQPCQVLLNYPWANNSLVQICQICKKVMYPMPHAKKNHVYLGIAQIAIWPPPPSLHKFFAENEKSL